MQRIRMPGVVDRHVHLGLVDRAAFAGTAVVEVHDLGWIAGPALRWRQEGVGTVAVRVAGPFHTPPGGYPRGRVWAPDDAVREVAGVQDARAAIEDAVALGVDRLKVVLHAEAGMFAPAVLEALVDGARRAGLETVAHVEGPGTARLALEVGVDVLAHAPWTEPLDDATVQAMAERCTWISTLAIHAGDQRRVALDNARRFVAAGGRLRYGTDLGNGDGPVGVRRDEVLALGEAGLSGARLIEALTGTTGGAGPRARSVDGPGPVPEDAAGVADWYLSARPAIVAP